MTDNLPKTSVELFALPVKPMALHHEKRVVEHGGVCWAARDDDGQWWVLEDTPIGPRRRLFKDSVSTLLGLMAVDAMMHRESMKSFVHPKPEPSKADTDKDDVVKPEPHKADAKPDQPKTDASKAESPNVKQEHPKTDPPKADPPKADTKAADKKD